jgi:hypothetical protein
MREVIVAFHSVDNVWKHDGDIISEYALVLGGLVISVREIMHGGNSFLEEENS